MTYTVAEFLALCLALSNDEYGFASHPERFPSGTCNGHEVSLCEFQWRSVIIDNCVYTIWPDDFCGVHSDKWEGTKTCMEYVEWVITH